MSEKEYRDLFETYNRDELLTAAVRLALEAARLRKELDEANGVIR